MKRIGKGTLDSDWHTAVSENNVNPPFQTLVDDDEGSLKSQNR